MNLEENILKQAIKIANRQLGKTWPNPTVACIITDKNDKILSYGVTETYGRPHAEKIAIKNLKYPELAYNLYVTLEPCCHTSQIHEHTCVNHIINSKVKNIFIGIKDPNKNICGKSITLLENAGLNVKVGFHENEIFNQNIGFFSKHLIQKTQISIKIATSLDGKIALNNKKSKWITCEKSRQFVHKLRSQNDALLTTNSTILNDNPSFTVRIDNKNSKIQPVRIALDRNLSLFEDINLANSLKFFENNYINPNCKNIIVVHNKQNIDQKISNLYPHIHFLYIENFSLDNIFKELTKTFSFNNIFIECGGKLFTSLIKENLINKLYWFHSNKIIGNDGIAAVDSLNYQDFDNQMECFEVQSIKKFDNDCLRTFINKDLYDVLHKMVFIA